MSNKYTYSVPFTESELHRDYVELRMSQVEIARKWGTTQKVVWHALHKMGIPTRKAAKRDQCGPQNSSWRGGRVLVATKSNPPGHRSAFGNGYYYIKLPPHPNANKSGYVAEHILVATRERGRPLSDDELVHHIDLNKHNNDPRNLVIASHRAHANWHVQLEEIAAAMLRDGSVVFDPTTGYRRV
jgi:hypothetical protein